MLKINLLKGAGLILAASTLACTLARQTPQPGPEMQQLSFEVQTATPTTPPVLSLVELTTRTPTPIPTATVEITATEEITSTQSITPTDEAPAAAVVEETAAVVPTEPPVPTATPTEPVPTAEPLQGGEWDFEVGFSNWINPYGDACPGAGLANGWTAFTTRDQFGSSCFNQTTWADNVFTGGNAQEITFAYVGNQAGIYKIAPTIPQHQYTVTAHMRREGSPSKVDVFLGIDLSGGTDWQAETVQWSPWNEDFENQWSKTEKIVTATGDSMTIFIQGAHPYPEPGGALRIDSISVVDGGVPAGE